MPGSRAQKNKLRAYQSTGKKKVMAKKSTTKRKSNLRNGKKGYGRSGSVRG